MIISISAIGRIQKTPRASAVPLDPQACAQNERFGTRVQALRALPQVTAPPPTTNTCRVLRLRFSWNSANSVSNLPLI